MKINVDDFNLEAEEELMQTISKFIKDRRTEMGLTQKDLSTLSNVHRSHIADIEAGTRPGVTIKFLSRIIKALETDLILRPKKLKQ